MFNGTLVILKSGVYFSHVFPVTIHANELWNTVIICGTTELHSFSLPQGAALAVLLMVFRLSLSIHPWLVILY